MLDRLGCPSAGEVRQLRLMAHLTQRESADIVQRTVRNWQQWEYGERSMSPAIWQYYCLVAADKINL